jgi:hypothetical protein
LVGADRPVAGDLRDNAVTAPCALVLREIFRLVIAERECETALFNLDVSGRDVERTAPAPKELGGRLAVSTLGEDEM